jgi:hypothetical protein
LKVDFGFGIGSERNRIVRNAAWGHLRTNDHRPNFAYVSYGSEADINGISALPAKADIDHVKFDVG